MNTGISPLLKSGNTIEKLLLRFLHSIIRGKTDYKKFSNTKNNIPFSNMFYKKLSWHLYLRKILFLDILSLLFSSPFFFPIPLSSVYPSFVSSFLLLACCHSFFFVFFFYSFMSMHIYFSALIKIIFKSIFAAVV